MKQNLLNQKYMKLVGVLCLALILASGSWFYFWKTPKATVTDIIEAEIKNEVELLAEVSSLQVQKWNDGIKVGESFVRGADWRSLISRALAQSPTSGFDQVTLCFGEKYQKFATPLAGSRQLINGKGVIGVEFQWKKRKKNYCGLKAVATNRSAWTQLQVFAKELKVPFSELNSTDLQMRVYKTRQFYVNLRTQRATQMYRGNQLISLKEINRDRLSASVQRMAQWLVLNTDRDGRMQYKYWPSSGKSSNANNTIRQFMATYSLQVWARRSGSEEAILAAEKNLRYNIKTFFGEEKGLGFIDEFGKRKLGAAALAALSIIESPTPDVYSENLTKLNKSLLQQWQPSGAFRTFILQERNDQHNFYPGEALFYWSHLIEKNPKSELLPRFMASVKYYMKWHQENLNPAFVPWHTQSYYRVWKVTRDSKLRDAIFAMNDWLVAQMQDLEAAQGYPFPDMQGRFFYPKGGYGPPHASATGVYLEGLADAFQLAREVDDQQRLSRYRKSILLGIRSAMQLEFQDEVDMFYISKREKVRGGLRTNEFDNTIRVDNIQHNLLAFFKILDRFQDIDYN